MGGGFYCSTSRLMRSDSMGYTTKSVGEIFIQKQVNNAMNPHGVALRESRDSNEHPNSLAIVLALDVTGSMGSIPHHLVKEGLPTIMDTIIKKGILDPQLMFLAIGDHTCDNSPLQIAQFESNDAQLDHWLTNVYLEGGGGGNDGESYLLAWYFAGHRTDIDCFKKRGQKGLLFTIGDEPCLKELPKKSIQGIMGEGQYDNFTSYSLLEKARSMYDVYHIHVKETSSGSRQQVMNGWKQLIGDNLIIANSHKEIPELIASKIIERYKNVYTGLINEGVVITPTTSSKPTEIHEML